MVDGHGALELCLVTADVELAARAERVGVERVLVDLETVGKAARQAGQNLFQSSHTLDDVVELRRVLSRTRLMVRTNPIHDGTADELRDVLAAGADVVMLAMARSAQDAERFVELVDDRAVVSILIENADALEALPEIVRVPGVTEIHVGLNDLRLSLGFALLFDPLLAGYVDRAAHIVREAGLRFGFGGVASPGASGLPVQPERIIGEHVRLDSRLGWLGRSFRQRVEGDPTDGAMKRDVDAIRECVRDWSSRSSEDLAANREALARDVDAWRRSLAAADS